MPVAVGFGVKTAGQARAIAAAADAVVVGSALVNAVRDSLSRAGKATSGPGGPCSTASRRGLKHAEPA